VEGVAQSPSLVTLAERLVGGTFIVGLTIAMEIRIVLSAGSVAKDQKQRRSKKQCIGSMPESNA
jgi:hypothetical protein